MKKLIGLFLVSAFIVTIGSSVFADRLNDPIGNFFEADGGGNYGEKNPDISDVDSGQTSSVYTRGFLPRKYRRGARIRIAR